MSGRLRNRGAVPDKEIKTTNERILKDCHKLYAHEENGLCSIAESLGTTLLAPREKITVLLIGNHSAGKSSFINWYIEEHVQKTGVAIETQGFTFVMSGRKRESLTGDATMMLHKHFTHLSSIPGLAGYLSTEISTSKQKKFPLVTFVDSPGLVDGGMKYPFDVNKAILSFGELADMIFVFFDPIGQALCKRTIDLVEILTEKFPDRIKFYLSKADEAGHESDRQRVMMQIVQELCKRPGLNRQGFDMPTIYIPNPEKMSRCVNQIDDVCKDVEKTINRTIQNNLNLIDRDCETVTKLIDDKLSTDKANANYNFKSSSRGILLCLFGFLLPVLAAVAFLTFNLKHETLTSMAGDKAADFLHLYFGGVWKFVPEDSQVEVLAGLLVVSLLAFLLSRWTTSKKETLSKKQRKLLNEKRDYINKHVVEQKKSLYKEYLQQCVSEEF